MADSALFAQIILFVGILVGATWRTLAPYLKKVQKAQAAGEDVEAFKSKYWATYVLSIVGIMFTVLEAFSMFNLAYPAGFESLSALLIAAILFGYTFNGVLNSALDIAPSDTLLAMADKFLGPKDDKAVADAQAKVTQMAQNDTASNTTSEKK